MVLTDSLANSGKLFIVTNCFGHLQDLDRILHFLLKYDKLVIFDNAATPYSFYNGVNSCNLGNASFISLHHTKPIGFGEGSLAIVDKHLEEQVRIACNFGFIDENLMNEEVILKLVKYQRQQSFNIGTPLITI